MPSIGIRYIFVFCLVDRIVYLSPIFFPQQPLYIFNSSDLLTHSVQISHTIKVQINQIDVYYTWLCRLQSGKVVSIEVGYSIALAFLSAKLIFR